MGMKRERNAPSQDVPIAKPPKQWNVESGQQSLECVSPQPPGVPQFKSGSDLVRAGSPLESLGPSLSSYCSGPCKDSRNEIDGQRPKMIQYTGRSIMYTDGDRPVKTGTVGAGCKTDLFFARVDRGSGR